MLYSLPAAGTAIAVVTCCLEGTIAVGKDEGFASREFSENGKERALEASLVQDKTTRIIVAFPFRPF